MRNLKSVNNGQEYIEMTDYKIDFDLEFIENIEEPLGRKITREEYDDIEERWVGLLDNELNNKIDELRYQLIDRWLFENKDVDGEDLRKKYRIEENEV